MIQGDRHHQFGAALGFFGKLGSYPGVSARSMSLLRRSTWSPTSRFNRRAVMVSSGVYIRVRLFTSVVGMTESRRYRLANQWS